ncbi:pilus protein [Escherichia coli]|nr:pilus protein [Escherichia coli]EGB6789062.1 pilus protein [Escherichia coli]EJN3771957.1 pilus protein [Escherichia coli]EJN3980858.1 pilus protein [Escherichia coli]EJN4338683.1 pilus protein [Escherichia coli]
MEARQGGDSSAGSVHDSPPRQGDARKRHSRENNRTDRNESSRKKKSSSRNKNTLRNRRITGMKRQKNTSEYPRNGRGGASARPLPAPLARVFFPARADGDLSSRLPGVFRPADE